VGGSRLRFIGPPGARDLDRRACHDGVLRPPL